MTAPSVPAVLGENRRATLAAIVSLTAAHDLPMPTTVDLDDGPRFALPGLVLRLDDGDRAGVRRWAEVLNLHVKPERTLATDGRTWVAVVAERWSHDSPDRDRPVWLHYQHVHVWASCALPDTEAQP